MAIKKKLVFIFPTFQKAGQEIAIDENVTLNQ